jgi:hypothetical protein
MLDSVPIHRFDLVDLAHSSPLKCEDKRWELISVYSLPNSNATAMHADYVRRFRALRLIDQELTLHRRDKIHREGHWMETSSPKKLHSRLRRQKGTAAGHERKTVTGNRHLKKAESSHACWRIHSELVTGSEGK